MATNRKLAANKILTIPPVLEALYAIKEKLADSDRDDQLEEVLAKEEKVKDAIIKLSLTGHEGIQLLVKQATEELKETYAKLMKTPLLSDSVIADTGAYAFRQQCLFNQRDLWLWFLNFFTDAEAIKQEVEEFVKEQEVPPIDNDY